MEKMGIDAHIIKFKKIFKPRSLNFEKIFEYMDFKIEKNPKRQQKWILDFLDAAMENVYQGSISQDEVPGMRSPTF